MGLLLGCSEDPPSREDAVRFIGDRCDTQVGRLTRLPVPRDVFRLSGVAGAAFHTISGTLGQLKAEGLPAMDDPAVQRYLDGALAANNAMADVARQAGFEDVDAVERALREAEDAGDDLDAAVDRLDLPDRCGRKAWGGSLFARAGNIADAERELMAPTGNVVDDVTTWCARYRRTLGRATSPGELEADRAWAFTVRHGVTLFGERLDLLDPPNTQQAAYDALRSAVADAAEALEPAETYAIDGDEERLQAVVEETQRQLRRVDALVRSLGVDC